MKLDEKEQLGKCLLLLQLQEDPVKLLAGLDGQVLKEKSEADSSGSESAVG